MLATACLKLCIPLPLRTKNSNGPVKPRRGGSEPGEQEPQIPNPAGQQSHSGTRHGAITHRLKGLVGSAGVRSEPIRIEDTVCVILVASEVIASHKVLGSWGNKRRNSHRGSGNCNNLSASPGGMVPRWDCIFRNARKSQIQPH